MALLMYLYVSSFRTRWPLKCFILVVSVWSWPLGCWVPESSVAAAQRQITSCFESPFRSCHVLKGGDVIVWHYPTKEELELKTSFIMDHSGDHFLHYTMKCWVYKCPDRRSYRWYRMSPLDVAWDSRGTWWAALQSIRATATHQVFISHNNLTCFCLNLSIKNV